MSDEECRKPNGNCSIAVNPDDGLPVQCVGPWAKEKHDIVRRFLHATRGVREKFVYHDEPGGACFVDLFAGPGRARVWEHFEGKVRRPPEFIEGTPLIALCEENFTDLVFCDLDDENYETLCKRTEHTRKARVLHGDCNAILDEIIQRIPPRGYTVALLDPFAASALRFETIRQLATVPRLDLIINFPLGSMRRNFLKYRDFEGFLGLPVDRWDVEITEGADAPIVHGSDVYKLLDVMRRQLIDLGYPSEDVRSPPITNTQNVVLYHLVFASRHRLGDKIWNSVTTPKSTQLPLL